jgi:preprotein translocase subunit SecB
MAQDETPGIAPNGSAGPDAGTGAQLIINAQYAKDLSFENPRAPQSLVQQKAPPEVNLEVDVKARNLAPELYEVLLTISADAKVEGEPVFIVQLTYSGVVTIKNAGTDDMLNTMIFIETPRLLFPFARNIIATATRDGGFPPLLINPIDFGALRRREQAKAQQPGSSTLNA